MNFKKIIKSSLLFKVLQDSMYNYLKRDPIKYTNYVYRKFYSQPLDLYNPKKLSEKIQYLKLFIYPENIKVVLAADKYTMHKYLKEKDLEFLSIPYIKIYEDVEQIDFEELPGKFVLKKTNASGMNLIVKDKKKLDISRTKKILEEWMSADFGKNTAELHYSAARSRIICEPFLELGDEYRFFMLSGKIAFIQVIKWDWSTSETGQPSEDEDLITGHSKHYRLYLNTDFNLLWFDEATPDITLTQPNYWKKLIEISKVIGKDFPLVRIDFNDVGGVPKITELTFTPANGFLDILRRESQLDIALGDWLELSDVIEKNNI